MYWGNCDGDVSVEIVRRYDRTRKIEKSVGVGTAVQESRSISWWYGGGKWTGGGGVHVRCEFVSGCSYQNSFPPISFLLARFGPRTWPLFDRCALNGIRGTNGGRVGGGRGGALVRNFLVSIFWWSVEKRRFDTRQMVRYFFILRCEQ